MKSTDDFPIEKIMEIRFSPPIDCFLQKIEQYFNREKTEFLCIIPSRPFRIMVIQKKDEEEVLRYQMHLQARNFTGPGIPLTDRIPPLTDIIPRLLSINSDSEGEYSEEESEDKQINTDKSFKSDKCVICLTKPPNVLFCNCGHIAICAECDKVKSLNTCPVCKFENSI